MNLQKVPILSMLTKKMSWLNERQRVLAQNIANADTPGFRPNDLKNVDFARAVSALDRKLTVAATAQSHIKPRIGNAEWRSEEVKKPFEVAPAGNAVVLEEEVMKVAETQADYQLITNLYKKNVGFIKAALGRRG